MKKLLEGAPRKVAAAFTIGTCAAGVLMAWFGYRVVLEWRRSAATLAHTRTADAVQRVTIALARDMQGVQHTVLSSANQEQFAQNFPHSAVQLAASAFARFPYPESFFVWRDVPGTTGPVFFYRRNRLPAWMPDDRGPNRSPVVTSHDTPIAELVLRGIQQDSAEGFHFSIFEMTFDGTPYQVVARLTHDDPFHQHLTEAVGFTVNLDWVRRNYFRDLLTEVAKTDSAARDLKLTVMDGDGTLVASSSTTPSGAPTSQHTFPAMFFDPLLTIGRSQPEIDHPYWTIQASTPSDSGAAAAMDSANRLLLLGGAAAGLFIFGLALTARAARASIELADVRSSFVCGVSHELKVPLATIRAAGEMLRTGKVRDENEQREYASLMVQEAKRLARLVDNLLAISRVTDVTTVYAFEPLHLDELVDEALQRLNVQLTKEGFTVGVDVPPDLPPVLADQIAMALLLDNLLDNAIRYSDSERHIEIRGRLEDGMVRLALSDRGRGIPPDEIQQVTRKFYRGRNAGFGGTGLGLAIVKRITDDHKGTLTIESDRGTTVTVALPAIMGGK